MALAPNSGGVSSLLSAFQSAAVHSKGKAAICRTGASASNKLVAAKAAKPSKPTSSRVAPSKAASSNATSSKAGSGNTGIPCAKPATKKQSLALTGKHGMDDDVLLWTREEITTKAGELQQELSEITVEVKTGPGNKSVEEMAAMDKKFVSECMDSLANVTDFTSMPAFGEEDLVSYCRDKCTSTNR